MLKRVIFGQQFFQGWTDALQRQHPLRRSEFCRGFRHSINGRRRTILRDGPLPLTRHARSGVMGRYLAPCADRMLRGYWQLVRGLV